MVDITFLKALRDKLKGGNIRSIHLNALPGRYASRLDVVDLNLIDTDMAKLFMDVLLTKPSFEFKISFDGIELTALSSDQQKKLGVLSKRLNSLFIENEDNFKEHGIKTFAFGYPLIIKPSRQDPTKIIKAPLFIWQLDIIKSFNKINTWSIVRNKTKSDGGRLVEEMVHSVHLNEVLISYLKGDEDILIPPISDEFLEDEILDQKEIAQECQAFLEKLNVTATFEEILTGITGSIQKIPEAKELEATANNKPWIFFGGVFGLYRTQKESIITDLDKLIENYGKFEFDKLKIEHFSGTVMSAVNTDPSQQSILNSLQVEPKKIIQGPPGTGKSQSLTALITNVLANKMKCLVVCEKKTALDVIKSNLHKENPQLSSLVAVIEDVNKDREGIVNSVRDRLTQGFPSFGSTNIQYDSSKTKLEEYSSVINDYHGELAKSIYSGKTWTQLVGEYIRISKNTDSNYLKQHLQPSDFEFSKNDKELETLVTIIKQAQKLFIREKVEVSPLSDLCDEIFVDEGPKLKQQQLDSGTEKFRNDFLKCAAKLKEEADKYGNWLEEYYSNLFKGLNSLALDYITTFKKALVEYGPQLFSKKKPTVWKIKILKIFSKKFEVIDDLRHRIVTEYLDIADYQKKSSEFQFSFLQSDTTDSYELYIESIEQLLKANSDWYGNTGKLKERYINGFSSSNLHSSCNFGQQVLNVEQEYNALITNFRNPKILLESPSNAENILQKIDQAHYIATKLETIRGSLSHFIEYYEWRKFYISLSLLQKKLVYVLIASDCNNWAEAFLSWYYYWLLALNESSKLPKNDDVLKELLETKNSFTISQVSNIIQYWTGQQKTAVMQAHSQGIKPTSLFNKRGSKRERRNSLRKIMQTDFRLFTDFFPVLMVSPSVCSSIIPLKEGLFDVVLFDEASQLRLEDTFPALVRGKIKIISGDSQQMPPSSYFQGSAILINPTEDDSDDANESQTNAASEVNSSKNLADSESLLEYAEDAGYSQSYLKIHYRSQHPYLIDFSNHAFYGNRLKPMPSKHNYRPIKYIQVGGKYEEQMNRDEARQVVDILLNHIEPNMDGKYPSVGIATLNLYQRNLILEEITKARQIKPEYDKKISDLGAQLFVKNLENIQGDERDIIIISTTFGRKADGSFRQNFGPIIQGNGYKLLNVIITRAKYRVFVCTSIPEEHILQYPVLLKQSGNTGRGVFYAYLAYAKAISDGNETTMKAILNQLDANCQFKFFDIEHDTYGSESPFEEEVYYALAAKIGQNRLEQQYRVGGFRIDLVVKSKINGNPIIAIECDGAKYHSSHEAYSWDMFRQKQIFEQYGYKFYRIWSTNWFNSLEKELKKVVSFVEEVDKMEAPLFESGIEPLFNDRDIVPVSLI